MNITLPMPLFIVIEDVGWWSGTDGSHHNQPFRTAMGRRHVPEDYEAIAVLGKKLGMRPLAAMVLCEWDRENILRDIPSATWMGKEWDNTHNRGDWLDRASDIIQKNEKHLELGLHGVGHEYWENGTLSRSEFHDENGCMRSDAARHLDYFGRLMVQNNLGPFPRVFVPPALNHSFGNKKKGFQHILKAFGVHYVSIMFDRARAMSPPIHEKLTWECGVILIERGEAPVPWHQIAASPAPPAHGPILPLHWANILHPDPRRNIEVVTQWVDCLNPIQEKFHWMLAPDTHSCWTQFAAKELATITRIENGVQIDLGKLAELPANTLTDHVYINIEKPCQDSWEITNGAILSTTHHNAFLTLKVQPDKHIRPVYLKQTTEPPAAR